MPTIVETLTQLGQDLRDTIAACRNLRTEITAYFESKKTEITNIIAEYRDRPPTVIVYCDPANGLDTNDGKTIAKPKKDIDAIIRGMGNNATEIRLLSDARLRYRSNVYPSLSIVGIQPAANPTGFIVTPREIGFLDTAVNSPDGLLGSFSSGLFLVGGLFQTDNINFVLLNVPSGHNFRTHFISFGSPMTFFLPTIRGSGSGNAPLIGAARTRATVFINPTLGANAAGKVFDGVAAGANPNDLWQYTTNLTSA